MFYIRKMEIKLIVSCYGCAQGRAVHFESGAAKNAARRVACGVPERSESAQPLE